MHRCIRRWTHYRVICHRLNNHVWQTAVTTCIADVADPSLGTRSARGLLCPSIKALASLATDNHAQTSNCHRDVINDFLPCTPLVKTFLLSKTRAVALQQNFVHSVQIRPRNYSIEIGGPRGQKVGGPVSPVPLVGALYADKPKLKVKMLSVSDDDVRKRLVEKRVRSQCLRMKCEWRRQLLVKFACDRAEQSTRVVSVLLMNIY